MKGKDTRRIGAYIRRKRDLEMARKYTIECRGTEPKLAAVWERSRKIAESDLANLTRYLTAAGVDVTTL